MSTCVNAMPAAAYAPSRSKPEAPQVATTARHAATRSGAGSANAPSAPSMQLYFSTSSLACAALASRVWGLLDCMDL